MLFAAPATFAALLDELAAYKKRKIVIKIGGNSIAEDPAFLASIAAQIAFLHGNGVKIVLVHGGGPQIDAALAKKGFTQTKGSDGRRKTDPAMMNVVAGTMAEISLQVAEALEDCGPSVFAAARSTLCFVRAKPLHPTGPGAAEDRTGLPASVDHKSLDAVLDAHEIVVLSSLGRDAEGHDYNINADDYAMAVATSLRAKRLILATNVAGVLDGKKRLISRLTPDQAEKLVKDGVIAGGMIPKVQSAAAALAQGVEGVAIINAHEKGALLAELLSPEGVGTLISGN
jgi:acetylglutamate kinase